MLDISATIPLVNYIGPSDGDVTFPIEPSGELRPRTMDSEESTKMLLNISVSSEFPSWAESEVALIG